jgi:NAD(P)-dependent dehydrogenase (short-subunit alcohol dehydrogenase family)
MKFEKLNAVVSGGASGLGFATAEHIVKAGGKVALLDVNEEQGHAAANKLGDAAIFLATDVSSETAVKTAVDKAVDSFGRLDVAVSCAGVLSAGRVISRKGPMPSDFFNKAIQVNLVGTFNLCKAAAEKMMENDPREDGERGVLINTASVAAFEGQIGQAAYSASKGGLVALTHALAMSLAPEVRVNCVSPGWIKVREESQLRDEDHAQHPAGRVGKAEDVAALVRYLLSPEASFITGQNFVVDGGMTKKMIYL